MDRGISMEGVDGRTGIVDQCRQVFRFDVYDWELGKNGKRALGDFAVPNVILEQQMDNKESVSDETIYVARRRNVAP